MEYGAKLTSVYAHDSSGELLGNGHVYTSHLQKHVVVQTVLLDMGMFPWKRIGLVHGKCFVPSILYSG